jgi:hypothetical protein
MLLVKKSFHLQLVQGGLGVGGKGNAAGVAHFPIQSLGLFIGVHGAGVLQKNHIFAQADPTLDLRPKKITSGLVNNASPGL